MIQSLSQRKLYEASGPARPGEPWLVVAHWCAQTPPGEGRERVCPSSLQTSPLPRPFTQLLLSCILYNNILLTSTGFSGSPPSHSSELSNLKRGHACRHVGQQCGWRGDPLMSGICTRAVSSGTLSSHLVSVHAQERQCQSIPELQHTQRVSENCRQKHECVRECECG